MSTFNLPDPQITAINNENEKIYLRNRIIELEEEVTKWKNEWSTLMNTQCQVPFHTKTVYKHNWGPLTELLFDLVENDLSMEGETLEMSKFLALKKAAKQEAESL